MKPSPYINIFLLSKIVLENYFPGFGRKHCLAFCGYSHLSRRVRSGLIYDLGERNLSFTTWVKCVRCPWVLKAECIGHYKWLFSLSFSQLYLHINHVVFACLMQSLLCAHAANGSFTSCMILPFYVLLLHFRVFAVLLCYWPLRANYL